MFDHIFESLGGKILIKMLWEAALGVLMKLQYFYKLAIKLYKQSKFPN